jgi:hypothetical protein
MTWQIVQQKLEKPDRSKKTLDDEIPLRGILKCHCGQPLSGAPSRGKGGNWYYYYKCKHSRHNNISAIKAHDQFQQILEYISLSSTQINRIRDTADESFESKLKEQREIIGNKKIELGALEEKLHSVEEKWISNQIGRDTYERWSSTYNTEIFTIKAYIERYTRDQNQGYKILKKYLHHLGDMKFVYNQSDTIEKRALVSKVFDSNLYYENGVYRTPTIVPVLAHNDLIMREKNLL